MENDDNHDRMVRLMDSDTLTAAARDLGSRNLRGGSPEVRWSVARLAAIRREIKRRALSASKHSPATH